MDVPRIISVDDHVLEPPTLWTERLPARYQDRCPRVVRDRSTMSLLAGKLTVAPRGVADGLWTDWWLYEDLEIPLNIMAASAGMQLSEIDARGTVYEAVRPGCWKQAERLQDMDLNHVEVSVCFPNVVARFCGQTFLNANDKQLSLLCIKAYNDWMIDEWCAGAGKGRLIPLTLIPLWDVDLAAAEVQRCADKGSHAVAFTENPAQLGLPSIHDASHYWDRLFAVCEATETVVNVHIGSSSTQPSTSPDAPHAVASAIFFQNTAGALCDHLVGGTFERFPELKLMLAEGQVGWIPYVLERLDNLWYRRDREATIGVHLPSPPSSYMARHVYGCIYNDSVGLANREMIGIDQILFETDYPHNDGTFPDSAEILAGICEKAGMDEVETYKFARGNAIEAYGLQRLGITH